MIYALPTLFHGCHHHWTHVHIEIGRCHFILIRDTLCSIGFVNILLVFWFSDRMEEVFVECGEIFICIRKFVNCHSRTQIFARRLLLGYFIEKKLRVGEDDYFAEYVDDNNLGVLTEFFWGEFTRAAKSIFGDTTFLVLVRFGYHFGHSSIQDIIIFLVCRPLVHLDKAKALITSAAKQILNDDHNSGVHSNEK